MWQVHSQRPSEQNPLNFWKKGAWAYPGLPNFMGYLLLSQKLVSYGLQILSVPDLTTGDITTLSRPPSGWGGGTPLPIPLLSRRLRRVDVGVSSIHSPHPFFDQVYAPDYSYFWLSRVYFLKFRLASLVYYASRPS